MQYIHSQNIIHHDLTPENMLLNLDWNVRIADFGQNGSPKRPEIPSFTDFSPASNRTSNNFRSLAPECYDGDSFPESDVSSFRMIGDELLTGQLSFPEDFEPYHIIFEIFIKGERPMIPEFMLPSAHELITDCWATEPEKIMDG
jgi:serine/threonine protein kinase